ncbi:GNAT family N-acetyltransferase [Usitatibacter palustris]|uniref:N-acetyltransferase domain-containing protein n=1 Tax=Usitatibacter palustris TaxID=2732487 RepID=A0A6M4H9W6_9PROT|nr:GNAT family N-acetyltransferase [Usitatibacter palustris]QJR16052.1 hypothetical protein DSM104440_02880 [Usitatibacter palustris]
MTKDLLFTSGDVRAFEMDEGDIPVLQAFFERNPEYCIAVGAQPPTPDEARDEITILPPAGYPYDKRWLIGFVDANGEFVGMANVLVNLFAAGVWHIGLFIVATSMHGRGNARAIYEDLEAWMRAGGARWSRLGVVMGNARAERFWERNGYLDVRKRHGVTIGKQDNTLRVMAKPLAGGEIAHYLTLVARDHPDAA